MLEIYLVTKEYFKRMSHEYFNLRKLKKMTLGAWSYVRIIFSTYV